MDTTTDKSIDNKCVICRKDSKSRCSRCHKVYYCSKQCQFADLREHKLTCRSPEDIKAFLEEHHLSPLNPDITLDQIPNLLLQDATYARCKQEVDRILTGDIANRLFRARVMTRMVFDPIDVSSSRVWSVQYRNIHAIIRSIKGEQVSGDFISLSPLSLDHIHKIFPNSVALKTYKNDPSVTFITVCHIIPLKMLNSKLNDYGIYHCITGIRTG
jgi:hypothetical protein